jgi:SAM-dependent methyltransferase
MYNEKIEGPLRGKKARILIAGCGTGREAVELAHVFPDAEVLAIDLSRNSLSYGIMKARECGIANVSFQQADILQLGAAKLKPFDYIASTGAIHHMEDPLAGWDALTALLKPGGLMRLCLYSGRSRESIREAQKIISGKKYDTSPAGIRRFRKDAADILKRKDYERITSYHDYYLLPECRDLLFHVHEHAFTLEQIDEYLQKNGLSFLGFNIPADILAGYRKENPGDADGLNLKSWSKFEQKYPETFTGMYRMWFAKN